MKNRLKEIREEHGMTQAVLCEKTGLSRATISKIENNENAGINTQTLVKIAAVFGVPLGDIFLF